LNEVNPDQSFAGDTIDGGSGFDSIAGSSGVAVTRLTAMKPSAIKQRH
jgi:hypothetical protein